jgi:hypothetical protein
MRPEDVNSPREKLSDLRIVYSGGEGPGLWSVAQFFWRNPGEEKRQRVGIRWNGAEDSKGNPTSSGNATWFVLPENLIADLVLTYAKWMSVGGKT